MRKRFIYTTCLLLSALSIQLANAQCSICTKTAQQLGEKPAQGMNAGILYLAFAPFARVGKFFASAIESGGHVKSMIVVRDGLADVCAIDAVCVAMAMRYRPDYLEGLVEIARSPSVPSLPYVTRSGDIDAMREALVAAFADSELQECREQLFLIGNSVLRPNAYERITDLESEMQKAGGLDLL